MPVKYGFKINTREVFNRKPGFSCFSEIPQVLLLTRGILMLLFYFVLQGDIWWERVGDTDLFHLISIIFDHFHGIPIDFPGCSFLPPHESCSMPFLWFSHEAVWAARFPDARETLAHADHGIDFWIFLGHTSTRQDQLSVSGSVASPRWVALILKGSHEHPVSCLMCNNMQIFWWYTQIAPKSAREQFHRSS